MNFNSAKIWSITDGSQGMISQANGLSNEFSDNIFEVKTNLNFPWSKLKPGIIPPFSFTFKNSIPENNKPDIIISCGRKSVYLSIYLKKKFNNLINIHIQNPKISFKKFNFIVAPNHDLINGKNVINSIGALHQFSIEKLNNQKYNFEIPKDNLISIIIGGQNNHYYFREKEIKDLCDKIIGMKKNSSGINLLVITSRRTEKNIKKILIDKLKEIAIIWTGKGINPYSFAIKHSAFFVLTSDSTSMISESAITGKPIYVYQLPYKRLSKRFKYFHSEFKKLQITRDFNNFNDLENWNYKPLDETKRIAGILKKRIIEENNES